MIRTLEIVLVLGFLLHIIQAFVLWRQNTNARPVSYANANRSEKVSWYSKSMTLLGTLILLFLVVHIKLLDSQSRQSIYNRRGAALVFDDAP